MHSPKKSKQNWSKIDTNRTGSIYAVTVVGILVVGLIASCFVFWYGAEAPPTKDVAAKTADSTHATGAPSSPVAPQQVFPVNIRKPSGPPMCFTGLADANGQPLKVSCSTCHTTRKPNFENKTKEDLNEFHGTLAFAHGSISCLSCHNPNDYDSLKLADGSRVEFSEVMTLCAQCHGQQMKDYEHGAHGGMNGYWDRSRGPRSKNNCIDCHHPHSPQFPMMQPTFKPRDRFLEKESH